MNTATTRIPLACARRIADALMLSLRMSEGCAVVGSIRREKPDVGDIDLIAPLPVNAIDTLSRRINDCFRHPKKAQDVLFGRASDAPTLGDIIAGGTDNFKLCQLRLVVEAKNDPDLLAIVGKGGKFAVPVQLHRYEPGRTGNRGWIELMRTGPADFGETVLSCWKKVCGTLNTPTPGSEHGFLVDSRGNRRPTPSEYSVFQAIGCLWVPPKLRTGAEALCRAIEPRNPVAFAHAMKHLGINDVAEVERMWNEETMIAATSGGGT